MAGNVITTGSHPKLLWPGIKTVWGRTYDQHEPIYTKLFEVDNSDKAYEEDVEVTGFGLAPRKEQGRSITYDVESQGQVTRYTNVAYALGYIVTREELADNLYEVVSKRRAKALAFSMLQTRERISANVYNRAFDSNYPIGDGAAAISASHPTVAGNFSNILATAADLSEAAVESLITQMWGATDARGNLISVNPESLIVPRQLFYEANRIYNSVLQNDTANNAINVLKATSAFPKGIVMSPYFSSATTWFIRSDVPDGPKFYTRDEMQFEQDNDFDTKNLKASAYMRFSVGVTDPRGLWGSNAS